MRHIRLLLLSAVLLAGIAPGVLAQDEAETAEWGADEYRIGIEDVLQISVWGEPDLTMSVVVRPDGRVSFPLIDDIDVAGRTPQEVRDEVAKRLAEFVREPAVTVIVEEINSFRVYVLGEVNQQGALNFKSPTRLLQAVAAAGGLTEFSRKKIVLLREERGQERRITIDYKRLMAGESAEPNRLLRPGDTLLVE